MTFNRGFMRFSRTPPPLVPLFPLALFLCLALAACDGAGSKPDTPSLEGRWSTPLGALGAAAGHCCGLDVTLHHTSSQLAEGTGSVYTPGERVGRYYTYPVEVRGTLHGRTVTINLQARFSAGQYSGTISEEFEGGRMTGRFSGFGARADTLVLLRLGE